MAFLDSLSRMAKNVSDKTEDAIGINKLNAGIAKAKNTIEDANSQLAEHYYKLYKRGTVLDETAQALCESIDECYTAIRQAEAQIESIKASRQTEK